METTVKQQSWERKNFLPHQDLNRANLEVEAILQLRSYADPPKKY